MEQEGPSMPSEEESNTNRTLESFPKPALDYAFDQVKDRGDWCAQTIRDLAMEYLKSHANTAKEP